MLRRIRVSCIDNAATQLQKKKKSELRAFIFSFDRWFLYVGKRYSMDSTFSSFLLTPDLESWLDFRGRGQNWDNAFRQVGATYSFRRQEIRGGLNLAWIFMLLPFREFNCRVRGNNPDKNVEIKTDLCSTWTRHKEQWKPKDVFFWQIVSSTAAPIIICEVALARPLL